MKASDIFGVAVRTIGLLVLLYGLYDIWSGLDNFVENLIWPPSQDSDSNTGSTLTYFVFGLPELILGVLLFFLADWLVNLAYRD
jgi:hypothetical protein